MAEHDVAIIGGGPSGLAAAAYAMRAQLDVALVARTLGGKVSYPFALRDVPKVDLVWGADLVRQMEEFVIANLANNFQETVTTIVQDEDANFVINMEEQEPIRAKTVILTTGARAKRLFVEGERKYWGSGVSFSAVSHASIFTGRDVAVVGDGPRALVAAMELASLANQVYLIAPRLHEIEGLPAAARVFELPNVSVFQRWEVQSIEGDDYVTAIQLVGINGEVRQLPVEGVFVQLELLPHNDSVRGLVELDEGGFVKINHRCETSVPGVFAAGDVTCVHAEQVPVAIGEGSKAAISAWEYVATALA